MPCWINLRCSECEFHTKEENKSIWNLLKTFTNFLLAAFMIEIILWQKGNRIENLYWKWRSWLDLLHHSTSLIFRIQKCFKTFHYNQTAKSNVGGGQFQEIKTFKFQCRMCRKDHSMLRVDLVVVKGPKQDQRQPQHDGA